MARRRRPNPKENPDKQKSGTKVSPAKDETTQPKGNETQLENPEGKNDPEWYARDPQLLLDGANIPYNIPFGAPLKYFDGGTFPFPANVMIDETYKDRSIPGVCSIVLKPSVGYSMLKTDPLNVCSNAFYTHVRYVNSGRKNYDPSDLMMYALTFGELYSFLIWAQRLYCYAFMYSQRNWYVGKALIEANNVDPDNIVRNLANFRYWINSAINKISSFCVPGDIYFFKRRAFLYQNYYLENPNGNIKDQLYQLVPEGWFRFAIHESTGAGKLEYKKFRSESLQDIEDITHYFNTLMENITGDEDFGLMSGDILKAYGANIIGLTQLGAEAALPPVYDPYVLAQIKNANIWGTLYRGDSTAVYDIGDVEDYVYGDVEQTPSGLLICQEALNQSDAHYYKFAIELTARKTLSVENPAPGVGDTIEGTRLISSFKQGRLNAGTEIAVNLIFTTYDGDDGIFKATEVSRNIIGLNPNNTVADLQGVIRDLSVINNFKYAPLPILMTTSVNDDVTYVKEYFTLGNLDNTTLLTNDMLNRIHEIALLSLFYVPGVAKLIS